MALRLEQGKFYRTRDGRVAGPAEHYPDSHFASLEFTVPLDGHPATYSALGRRIGSEDHPEDLVSEEVLRGSLEDELLSALLVALPYVTDIVDDPEQRACFKQGVPQRHVKQIKAAIARAEGQP